MTPEVRPVGVLLLNTVKSLFHYHLLRSTRGDRFCVTIEYHLMYVAVVIATRPSVTSLIRDTNTATKVDVEAMI